MNPWIRFFYALSLMLTLIAANTKIDEITIALAFVCLVMTFLWDSISYYTTGENES